MPFTQDNQKNLKVCQGCDEHCHLGARIEKDNVIDTNNKTTIYERIYPTLNGHLITSYIDRFGKKRDTVLEIVNGIFVATGYKVTDEMKQFMLEQQQERAHKIAKLCDNYKTR